MNQNYVKSVRLSEQQAREVLDALERETRDIDLSRRAHERVAFHLLDVAVRIIHPEGAEGRYLVVARNLSAGGMSFIHGGFLHTDSRCEATLPTVWGGREKVKGRVASCRHHQGQLHEIGVQFDAPIDPRRFIADATSAPVDAASGAESSGTLSGSLLYVDPSEADRRLFCFHLRTSGVTVNAVDSLAAAQEAIRANPPDVVVMELDLADGVAGETAIGDLRKGGYRGPVVFMTGVTDQSRLKAAKDSGPADILLKPYSYPRFLACVARWMRKCDGAGPIHSTLDAGAETAELISFYLGHVQGLVEKIREAVKADQVEPCLRACRTLMDTGAGYGFAPVASAARGAVGSLSVAAALADAVTDVQRLLMVCERITAEPAPAAPATSTDDASLPASAAAGSAAPAQPAPPVAKGRPGS